MNVLKSRRSCLFSFISPLLSSPSSFSSPIRSFAKSGSPPRTHTKPTYSSVKSESSRKWLQRQYKDEYSVGKNTLKGATNRRRGRIGGKGRRSNPTSNTAINGIVGGSNVILPSRSSSSSPPTPSSYSSPTRDFVHSVSRASYKLEDMLESWTYTNDTKALDLGSAPGGWMEYHAYRMLKCGDVGGHSDDRGRMGGVLVGVDLLDFNAGVYARELQSVGGEDAGYQYVNILKGDFLSPSILSALVSLGPYDILTCDVGQNRTGDKSLDSVVQNELAMDAMRVGREVMNDDGVWVGKYSRGEGWREVNEEGKKTFRVWKNVKPTASRGESREGYFIGEGFI